MHIIHYVMFNKYYYIWLFLLLNKLLYNIYKPLITWCYSDRIRFAWGIKRNFQMLLWFYFLSIATCPIYAPSMCIRIKHFLNHEIRRVWDHGLIKGAVIIPVSNIKTLYIYICHNIMSHLSPNGCWHINIIANEPINDLYINYYI